MRHSERLLSWRRLAALLAVLGLIALTGCASTIRSDVTTFHEWNDSYAGATFAFNRTGEQQASLEHKTYEDMVRDELIRLGLREAPAGQARLAVGMKYGMQSRDMIVHEDVPDPFWYDPWWPYRRPWWPSPYWGERTYTVRVFERSLSVTLDDRTPSGPKRVFEATARSEGRIGELPVVMPYLVRSIFLDFPGASGKTREVKLPYED